MRVLGIDPGSRITGLGIVEPRADAREPLKIIASECIKGGNASLPERLAQIHRRVSEIIQTHEPQIAVIEKVFFARNARSALVLGQASGSAVCAAQLGGCEIVDYTALQIKQAVVGTGSAQKAQVQHMVRVLLGLDYTPTADAADALACAICHIHTAQAASKINRALD